VPTEGSGVQVDLWIWVAFLAFIFVMLGVDLFAHRDGHTIGFREAAWWSVLWTVLGLGFAGVVWVWQGSQAGGEYLAGYLLERSLSIDNLFVFVLIFRAFAVPAENQHRVLFLGVLGALVFRAAFIAAGATLLETFHWTIYLFGAFLVFTGTRMVTTAGRQIDPGRNPVLKVLARIVPSTEGYRGQRLTVREAGRRLATPMLGVLLIVEITDVLFAVDSIPAIFAVTRDTFLVFTSNAFAILGLRALYFLVAGMVDRFHYLKVGLAAVLVFVGAKMLLSEVWVVPTAVSLAVIALSIGASIVASLRRSGTSPQVPPTPPERATLPLEDHPS
jgi:tellurite resistance protein TerC